MCNNSCRECPRKVYSSAVTVTTIDGTDTLVIDIPQQNFNNGCGGCLVITQNIPTTATIAMPVAISIGGVTTTVYPVLRCDCSPVTACALRTRTRYPFTVFTTPTGGIFKIRKNLSCAPDNALTSIPVPPAAGG